MYRGKRRTFLIRRPGGRGMIIHRFGPAGGDTEVWYQLVPRVRIRPELEFVETARRTVKARWAGEFARAWHETVMSAGPGRVGPRRRLLTQCLIRSMK